MGDLSAAPITFILIAANVAASLFAFSNRDFLYGNLLTTRGVLQARQYKRVVTSGFIHGGQMHLLVNMLTLFFFGPYLEMQLGPTHFLIVYFGALLAGSGWALFENRRNPDYAALGASGAISGVVLAFCLFEPFSMLLLFFVVPMPAIGFAILYVVFSAYMSTRENTIIGHEAHLGGALGGALLTVLLRPDAWTRFIRAIEDLLG